MINTHDYQREMREEARRSKERVRQLLAIQIQSQLATEQSDDECDSNSTWTDISRTGEFEAICV